MATLIKTFRGNYTVSGGKYGVVVYKELPADRGYTYQGELYYRKDGSIVNQLSGLPGLVLEHAKQVFDSIPQFKPEMIRKSEDSHCFYCHSRVQGEQCPGCGARDWDRN